MKKSRKRKKLPRSNWKSVGAVDLLRIGEYPGTCDNCGRTDIRYLHILEHRKTDKVLRVGSVCASRLCSGAYDPKQVERRLLNLSNRRMRFPGLRGWRVSDNGNDYIGWYSGNHSNSANHPQLEVTYQE